jgi:Spy/CpxP family protein refolding chaperone
MRKHISLGFILASALAATTVAIAAPSGQNAAPDAGQSHGWHGHGHHGDRGDRGMGLDKLNLTDAQKASVKQIMHGSMSQNKSQRDALRQQRDAFHSMTPDQVGYQAAATRMAQAEGDAMQQRVLQRATIEAKIYAVLTPTQKAQLATMKTQREARKAQWKKFKSEQPAPGVSTSAQ